MTSIKKDIDFELLNIKIDIISYFLFVSLLVILFSSGMLISLFEQIKLLNDKLFFNLEIKLLYSIANFIYASTFFAMIALFLWFLTDIVPKTYINLFYGWEFLPINKKKIILLIMLPITIVFCNIFTTSFIIIFYYSLFFYWKKKN